MAIKREKRGRKDFKEDFCILNTFSPRLRAIHNFLLMWLDLIDVIRQDIIGTDFTDLHRLHQKISVNQYHKISWEKDTAPISLFAEVN